MVFHTSSPSLVAVLIRNGFFLCYARRHIVGRQQSTLRAKTFSGSASSAQFQIQRISQSYARRHIVGRQQSTLRAKTFSGSASLLNSKFSAYLKATHVDTLSADIEIIKQSLCHSSKIFFRKITQVINTIFPPIKIFCFIRIVTGY